MWSAEGALVASLNQNPQSLPSDYLTHSLHKCRNNTNLAYARHVHSHISDNELRVFLELIPFIMEYGSMRDAQEVFETSNQFSWPSLIQVFVQRGQPQEALSLLKKMQGSCTLPQRHTYLTLLKACSRLRCVDSGREIHAEIIKGALEHDPFIGNALVAMYAKCNLLAEAGKVFYELPVRDEVSWNSLIAGYVEHGLSEEALLLLEQMVLETVSLNVVTLVCGLKACGDLAAISKGREFHGKVITLGYERDSFLGNALVDMYVKCGSVPEAYKVFDELAVRTVISWNSLIAANTEQVLVEDVLDCLDQMQMEGLSPTTVTFVHILKHCSRIGAVDKGYVVHTQTTLRGFDADFFVAGSLMDMYSNCGSLAEAKDVFDMLPFRNLVLWNTIIELYAQQGLSQEVLTCIIHMQLDKISPDNATFVCALKSCDRTELLEKGHEIHTLIVEKGFERDPFLGSSLISMYVKCGLLLEALKVFNNAPDRDVVIWSALMEGYAQHNLSEEVLTCLEQMSLEGIFPNAVTYICSLKACNTLKAIERGQELHAEIVRLGLESNLNVGNTLVDMYGKCGLLLEARKVLMILPFRDIVSWNALIARCADHELSEEVFHCLQEMRLEGIYPNTITFVSALKACSSTKSLKRGREVHAEIVKEGYEQDLCVGNSLVKFFASCNSLGEAQDVFNELSAQGVIPWEAVISSHAELGLAEEALSYFMSMQMEGLSCNHMTWNAVVLGYAEQGESTKAFSLYAQMQEQGLLPDSALFIHLLKSCGHANILIKGLNTHAMIQNILGHDVTKAHLETALVNMYCKCGNMVEAQQVFNLMSKREIVVWNALITGYVRHGESECVFNLFTRMREEGIRPNDITFLCVLSVCSQVGCVHMGQRYFKAMVKDYSLSPTVQHHNCVIDLLGRAGQVDEALMMMKRLHLSPDSMAWSTMLGACQKWNKLDLARQAFEWVVRLDEKLGASFVLMSNIYAVDCAQTVSQEGCDWPHRGL